MRGGHFCPHVQAKPRVAAAGRRKDDGRAGREGHPGRGVGEPPREMQMFQTARGGPSAPQRGSGQQVRVRELSR